MFHVTVLLAGWRQFVSTLASSPRLFLLFCVKISGKPEMIKVAVIFMRFSVWVRYKQDLEVFLVNVFHLFGVVGAGSLFPLLSLWLPWAVSWVTCPLCAAVQLQGSPTSSCHSCFTQAWFLGELGHFTGTATNLRH